MCGIIMKVSKSKTPVNREILEQFEDQKSRGTQGFGSIFIDKDGKMTVKRATSETLAIIDLYLNNSSSILFHHRSPSSSRNKISQTHPVHISSGSMKNDYYFMHNGVISNSDERKKAHEELGFVYSTDVETTDYYNRKERMFNDTECLGTDIARFIEGQTNHVGSVGSAAFFMVQVDKKTAIVEKIFFGRNSGNPLKLYKRQGEIMMSSEGKGEEVKEDLLYSFDPKTDNMKLSKKSMVIPRFTKAEEKETKEAVGFETSKSSFQSFKDDDDDYGGYHGYSKKIYDWEKGGLETELDNICEDFEDEAVRSLGEFFEEIKDIGNNQMFKIDVTDKLKEIATYMIGAQEECQKKWSESMTKELDKELEEKLDRVEREAALPEKLNSK